MQSTNNRLKTYKISTIHKEFDKIYTYHYCGKISDVKVPALKTDFKCFKKGEEKKEFLVVKAMLLFTEA